MRGSLLPKIFFVNWFRKDENNKYLWPGFGENSRILKWILERTKGVNNYVKTPIGYVPDIKKLDLDNLDISDNDLKILFEVNTNAWSEEIDSINKYYKSIYKDNLPEVLKYQFENMKSRFNKNI